MTTKRSGPANNALVKARAETRALVRRVAKVADEASGGGISASTAVFVGVVEVCFFDAEMTNLEVADWFRKFADDLAR